MKLITFLGKGLLYSSFLEYIMWELAMSHIRQILLGITEPLSSKKKGEKKCDSSLPALPLVY